MRFSFFKLGKHKVFDYSPKSYDPQTEVFKEIRAKYRNPDGTIKEASVDQTKANIRMALNRNYHTKYLSNRKKGFLPIKVWIYTFIIMGILGYYILFKILPKLDSVYGQ